jgi:hypothetical protein
MPRAQCHNQEEPIALSPHGTGRGVKVAALPAPTQWRRRGPAGHRTKPLTLTLSQREGAPLNWRPSADAVAGNGRPLSWAPSADAVAGGGDTKTWLNPRRRPRTHVWSIIRVLVRWRAGSVLIAVASLPHMSRKISAYTESGSSTTIGLPASPPRRILGSSGSAPRNGT